MSNDGAKITDAVAIQITEKPQQSQEELAEISRLRLLMPDKWYPIEIKPGWQNCMIKNSMLKAVFKNGDILFGILSEITPVAFRLQPGTVLLNDELSSLVGVALKSKNPITQMFTGSRDAVDVEITETVKTPPVKSGDDAGKNKDTKKRSERESKE